MAYEALTIPGWSTLDNAAPLRWLEFSYAAVLEIVVMNVVFLFVGASQTEHVRQRDNVVLARAQVRACLPAGAAALAHGCGVWRAWLLRTPLRPPPLSPLALTPPPPLPLPTAGAAQRGRAHRGRLPPAAGANRTSPFPPPLFSSFFRAGLHVLN